MADQRREAYFSGLVQGIGFRDAARRTAGEYEVAGYVRNLPDGRVHLVAEGAEDELTAFLGALQERMADFIRDVRQDVRPATGEFTRFEIRF